MTSRKFQLFGDESQFCGAVTYGVVIVATEKLQEIESEITKVKSQFGLKPDDRIHCREIFNQHAKAKTAFKELSKAEIFLLFRDLLACCNNTNARLWVSYLNSAVAPDFLLFQGQDKNKVTAQKWDIRDVKVQQGFAYHTAIVPILHALSHENCETWVDNEKSKIATLLNNQQANRFKSLFPIGHNDQLYVPNPIEARKMPLIDVADILSYSAAHHLTKTHFKDKPYYDSLLDGSIGFSEVHFNTPSSGPVFSIRVPDNHKNALQKWGETFR